jgi:hypothetical protein
MYKNALEAHLKNVVAQKIFLNGRQYGNCISYQNPLIFMFTVVCSL